MSHEISQLNLSDRQLQANGTRSKASVWTDIGEAQITHTIFGKAKVRIIHKQDKARRALLLTALAALATVAWLGWSASVQVEPPPSAEPSAAPSDSAPDYARVLGAEPDLTPDASPSVTISPGVPPQTAISHPAIAQPGVAQAQDLNGAAMAMTPPLTAGKPQAAPVAANNNAARKLANVRQPPQPSSRSQPEAVVPEAPRPSPAAENQEVPVSAQP